MQCTPAQRGFASGHATSTNLLECLSDWTMTVQNKKSVTEAYIDLTRAFDFDSITQSLQSYSLKCILMVFLVMFILVGALFTVVHIRWSWQWFYC